MRGCSEGKRVYGNADIRKSYARGLGLLWDSLLVSSPKHPFSWVPIDFKRPQPIHLRGTFFSAHPGSMRGCSWVGRKVSGDWGGYGLWALRDAPLKQPSSELDSNLSQPLTFKPEVPGALNCVRRKTRAFEGVRSKSHVTLGRLATGLEPPSSHWKAGFDFLEKHVASGSGEGRSPACGDTALCPLLCSGLWPKWCIGWRGGTSGPLGTPGP